MSRSNDRPAPPFIAKLQRIRGFYNNGIPNPRRRATGGSTLEFEMTDDEILTIAKKYGTSQTRHRPTYYMHDGSPTGETYPQTDWDFGQEDLLGFAHEIQTKSTGLDQLIERIRFLEQQIAERKNK